MGVSGLEEKVVTKIFAVCRPDTYKEGIVYVFPNVGQNESPLTNTTGHTYLILQA